MALEKSALEAAILATFVKVLAAQAAGKTPPELFAIYAADLATAFDTFVKTGTVTGACATPSGPGTITGTIT